MWSLDKLSMVGCGEAPTLVSPCNQALTPPFPFLDPVQVYGSAHAGRDLVNSDPAMAAAMAKAGEALNLAEHSAGGPDGSSMRIRGPCDIEVRDMGGTWMA